MPSGAKVSCMTTSFDDKNLELRAFPNEFMSGNNKTVIEGIKDEANTVVIAKAFDFEEKNLSENVKKEIIKNQKNRLSINGLILKLEDSKKLARNSAELSNIQKNIDNLILSKNHNDNYNGITL